MGNPIRTYTRLVFQQWKAVLVTWLGFGGLIAGLTVLDIWHWPAWVVVVGLLLGLSVAQYKVWRSHPGPGAAQRLEVKRLLGEAQGKGRKLVRTATVAEALRFTSETHTLIKAAFGDGEASLFLDRSKYTFFTPRAPGENEIRGGLNRLSELIARGDTITIRPDFDPSKF